MANHSLDNNEDHHDERLRPPSFWRSRAGICLITALVSIGLLLAYEHRAHIFGSGWILWLPLLACLGMHFFMHGGHGSGGDKS